MKSIRHCLLSFIVLTLLADSANALDWTQEAYPEDGWIQGRAEFGFGDGDESTELSQGWSTYYIRYSFPAESMEGALSMILEINYDDAFVAYINGVEVARSANMPQGIPTHSTLATVEHEGGQFESYDLTWVLDANYWPYVTNYSLNLSVEVHQVSPTDEDVTLAVRLLLDGVQRIAANSFARYWPENSKPVELVTDPITVIQRPLINIPAIVERDSSFEITCGAPSGISNWSAELISPYARSDVELTAMFYDGATSRWLLQARVPAQTPMGLYHLVVNASGGIGDTTAQSVRVIDQPKEDFYFVHLTDTHIPERGGSTLPFLEEIIQEINIINPEFVLISGDYVNRSYRDQMEIGQLMLERFQVPVFLTSGNHDIGDGMKPWWDFFGWNYLNTSDTTHWSGGPVTQDYSFDYGNLHLVAPMTWVNYINFQYWTYGYHSMIPSQIDWLHQDLSSLEGNPFVVMFYHYDFGWYDDQPQMPQFFNQYGVDLALWGHTHHEAEYQDGPTLSLNTAAAQSASGGFRLLKFQDGQLTGHPHLWNGNDISLDFSGPNDGTSTFNTATIANSHNVSFEHALVRFQMPSGEYPVQGGQILQTIDLGNLKVYEVEVQVPANGQAEVTIGTPVPVGGQQLPVAPAEFALLRSHPNPFNASTTISFQLLRTQSQPVTLEIYNIRGQEVTTLLDRQLPPGRHAVSWNGCDRRGHSVASGLYLCRLSAGHSSQSLKMMLLR